MKILAPNASNKRKSIYYRVHGAERQATRYCGAKQRDNKHFLSSEVASPCDSICVWWTWRWPTLSSTSIPNGIENPFFLPTISEISPAVWKAHLEILRHTNPDAPHASLFECYDFEDEIEDRLNHLESSFDGVFLFSFFFFFFFFFRFLKNYLFSSTTPKYGYIDI